MFWFQCGMNKGNLLSRLSRHVVINLYGHEWKQIMERVWAILFQQCSCGWLGVLLFCSHKQPTSQRRKEGETTPASNFCCPCRCLSFSLFCPKMKKEIRVTHLCPGCLIFWASLPRRAASLSCFCVHFFKCRSLTILSRMFDSNPITSSNKTSFFYCMIWTDLD